MPEGILFASVVGGATVIVTEAEDDRESEAAG